MLYTWDSEIRFRAKMSNSLWVTCYFGGFYYHLLLQEQIQPAKFAVRMGGPGGSPVEKSFVLVTGPNCHCVYYFVLCNRN